MRFDLTIHMDNAAFGDTDADRSAELQRALEQVRDKLALAWLEDVRRGADVIVRDVNGNTIGRATITA